MIIIIAVTVILAVYEIVNSIGIRDKTNTVLSKVNNELNVLIMSTENEKVRNEIIYFYFQNN